MRENRQFFDLANPATGMSNRGLGVPGWPSLNAGQNPIVEATTSSPCSSYSWNQ